MQKMKYINLFNNNNYTKYVNCMQRLNTKILISMLVLLALLKNNIEIRSFVPSYACNSDLFL